MREVNNEFNRICKEKYAAMGFVRTGGKTYARINNELIQVFHLFCSQYVPKYDVRFYVQPLCSRDMDGSLGGNGERLVHFDVDRYTDKAGWWIEPGVDDIARSVESIVEAIDRYLIPFFQRCYDCESTLEESMKLKKLFDDNRKELLRRKGIRDCAEPLRERMMFDEHMFFMAIKSSNYGLVREYLQFHIPYCEKKLKELDIPRPRDPEFVLYLEKRGLKESDDESQARALNSRRERLIKRIEVLRKVYGRLEAGEYGYFETIIENREKEMMEFIKEKYPRLLKTQRRNGWA